MPHSRLFRIAGLVLLALIVLASPASAGTIGSTKADSNAAPIVLPELLTPSIVLDALSKAGRSKNAEETSAQTKKTARN